MESYRRRISEVYERGVDNMDTNKKLQNRWIENEERISKLDALIYELDEIADEFTDSGLKLTGVYMLLKKEVLLLCDENRFIESTDALRQ